MLPWAFGDVVSAAAGGGVDVVGDGGPVTGAGFCFILFFLASASWKMLVPS